MISQLCPSNFEVMSNKLCYYLVEKLLMHCNVLQISQSNQQYSITVYHSKQLTFSYPLQGDHMPQTTARNRYHAFQEQGHSTRWNFLHLPWFLLMLDLLHFLNLVVNICMASHVPKYLNVHKSLCKVNKPEVHSQTS